MQPVEPKIGDLIVSNMTERKFVIESVWEDGYFKCRPLNSNSIDDYEYINANAIKMYWTNKGPVDDVKE